MKDYRPTDPQMSWFLAKFITDIRARSLDPVLMRANWLSAYDFATERASLFLNEYARASNPFAEVGRRTVSVQVTSVVRASDDSFRINWSESEYERGGHAGTTRWTAVLTVKVKAPRSAETLRKNPLGLYIDAIDWSRELEPANDRGVAETLPSPSDPVADAPSSGVIPLGSPLDPYAGEPASPSIPERSEP